MPESCSQQIEHPSAVLKIIEKDCSFPKHPLFGAVSTVYKKESLPIPHVRVMRIYDFTESGNLILLTHTGSHKWQEFSNNPYISISIISEDKLIQLIVIPFPKNKIINYRFQTM